MEELVQTVQFLSEKTLQDIAKGPLVKFTASTDDSEKVNRVWQSLIQTASDPSLSHQHTSAAYHALSAFVDAAVTSQHHCTQQLALESGTWLAIFDIYLSRYEDAKPKPLKQLLGSITTILVKYYRGDQRTNVQKAVAEAILPSVVLGEPRSRLKGSLVCLEIFLRKGAILPSELISLLQIWLAENRAKWVSVFEKDHDALYSGFSEPFTITAGVPSEELATKIFILGLLTQTNNRQMSGTSGSVLAAFLQKLKGRSFGQQVSHFWVSPVRHMLLQNTDNLESLSAQILHPLFTADPHGFMSFVEALPLRNLLAGDMADAAQSEYMLLFASLQMGKKANLVHEDYDSSKQNDTKQGPRKLVLNSQVIGKFLLHREPNIRIAALSLLVTTFSTVKPFTTIATTSILRALPSMHAGSDSYTRGEIMSLTRKFLIRLKSGILKEGISDAAVPATGKEPSGWVRSDEETKEFLKAYIQFLESDLVATASYPRHASALRALKLLLQSGLDPRTDIAPLKSEVETRWKLHVDVFGPRLLRLLVDLLLDPFEEVRQTSLSILNLFPRQVLLSGLIDTTEQQPTIGTRLTDALARAESIASKTSRADNADTVARLYHILFCAATSSDEDSNWWATKQSVVNTILTKLEERLLSSGGLFNSTMRGAPLHGYMSGLRYIVLMPKFYSLLSSDSDLIAWKSVHDRIVTICDKVWQEVKPVLCIDSPEGHTDEPTEDLSVGPKDILSYSWRALRESSMLLHATQFNTTYGPDDGNGLQLADFEAVGRTSFTQLAELRHRGAFSTVSQTFATCCQRCSDSKDVSIQELPKLWYQEAKATIFESAAKLTRRSAGLPALVTGILVASPGSAFFKQALDELHEIARLPVEYDKNQQYRELPQVHAMNCLKEIFTNTKLGPFTESFIMPALTLSAERLGSPIWALRNSGLMLFRALLIRMCRLVPGVGAGFGGISGSEPGSKISFPKYPGLPDLLSKLLASTKGTVTEGTDIITERIFPALRGNATENLVHGISLCVRYALRRFAATTDVFWTSHADEILATVRHVLATLFPVAKSPFTATALVEILSDTLERSFEACTEDRLATSIDEICAEHDIDGILSYAFNGSQAGWNLESKTRASSLLRRALSWCTILKMLALRQWSEISGVYRDVSEVDADAATWILEQLEEKVDKVERFRKPLLDLYAFVILNDAPSSAKTAAVSNLASILEELLSCQESTLSGLALPCDDLTKAFRPEADIKSWNRHATDSALRLQGCLLAIRGSSNDGHPLSSIKQDIHSWIVKLRSALSEEVEFTTRFAAVQSLHSFSRSLRPSGSSPRADSSLLDIYLIMYDMLNDDDEELRDIAASTASWVLSYSSVSPNAAVALGPLNASALLANFILDQYSDSVQLTRRVICYLTGQEPRISGSDDQTHLIAVSELLTEYCQDRTALFVEEKQNLFIDEVRELDVWSPALKQLKRNAYPETLVRQISSWVSEGLGHLSAHIAQESGQDGLLGWVSRPESFTLGVRLISISSALASPSFEAPELMDVEQQQLRKQLQTLLSVSKSAAVHDEWLVRIRSGLC
ncbi:Armadillo-like helical [Penicillium maclennaniae]|uniref:Armadillo-like helical n=1 Tax=Penicillium maclennaniae TaxID=1343394 RepID=UPI002540AE57|nr:Armadillo-like helical [Penicillium maclennaniae]KAJ5669950.1 Armadillo-like helical [Penicillium maclennaniae]